MKRAFLIDFENVKSAGLVGLEDLNETDQVIILYSCLLYTSPSPRDRG